MLSIDMQGSCTFISFLSSKASKNLGKALQRPFKKFVGVTSTIDNVEGNHRNFQPRLLHSR